MPLPRHVVVDRQVTDFEASDYSFSLEVKTDTTSVGQPRWLERKGIPSYTQERPKLLFSEKYPLLQNDGEAS